MVTSAALVMLKVSKRWWSVDFGVDAAASEQCLVVCLEAGCCVWWCEVVCGERKKRRNR